MTEETGENREKIYTVDRTGNLISLEYRDILHLAKSSKLHAAVIGMLRRSDGKYLLQRRASIKLGGSRLDVSATTHVRNAETYETALLRSFQNELRISDRLNLDHLFDFTYQEELGEHKENEFCKVYLAIYDGRYDRNPSEIDDVEFMTLKELKEYVSENEPKTTKWLRETVKRLS